MKRNFTSTDKKEAINSFDVRFAIGDIVIHQDEKAGEATIISFEVDEETNEVKVHTDKGYAHIDFLDLKAK